MRHLLGGAVLLAAALAGPASAQTATVPAAGAAPAYLTLGGYNILCLRGTAGGMTPDQRVSVITSRLTPLLGNPVIKPSDVAVYIPPAKSRYNRYPVVYALGRRIVTADPATVKASGLNDTPLEAATLWAKKLQQVLPRINWRPSNMPEPNVPKDPPLTITHDFSKVGGQVAPVTLRDKVVLKLRGPQNAGMTAAERADLLTERLKRLANDPNAYKPDAVQVADQPDGSATLTLAGTPVLTVTASDLAGSGCATPDLLASSWAKNLRGVLAPATPVLPAAPIGEPPSDAALPPTLVPPTAAPAPPATNSATVAPTPGSSNE
jgi:hypothetical protein